MTTDQKSDAASVLVVLFVFNGLNSEMERCLTLFIKLVNVCFQCQQVLQAEVVILE